MATSYIIPACEVLLRAPRGTRTHTERSLNPLTLPIGLEEHCAD
jgi:hypothetical protein